MAIVYHGTYLDYGICIAERGLILSPFDQMIEQWEKIFRTNPERMTGAGYDPNTSLEQWVFINFHKVFQDHEIEHRFKSVSLARSFSEAYDYAIGEDERKRKGLVLGIEIDDKTLAKYTTFVIYVPRKFSISNLREVYMTPEAGRLKSLIKQKFEKYKPISLFTISDSEWFR